VVCNNGFYHVFLLIYVKRYDILKIFPSDHNCDKWGIGGRGRKAHNCLSDAQGEAN
jgi:hypothetical protein